MAECEECGGAETIVIGCRECDGRGYAVCPHCDSSVECDECNGVGEVEADCPECVGDEGDC